MYRWVRNGRELTLRSRGFMEAPWAGGVVLLAARLAMECGFRETWVFTDAGFQAVGLEDFLAEAEAPRPGPLGRLLRSL